MSVTQYQPKSLEFSCNCYFITDPDNNCVVVDPGVAGTEIADYCKQQKLNVTHILLTHGHFDHIAGVLGLQQQFPDVKVVASIDEVEILADPDKNLAASFLQQYDSSAYTIVPDITVKDGEKLTLGLYDFTIMATPFHTKGSICYICADAVFTGDTLFFNSHGRTDFYSGDANLLGKSLSKFADLDDDCIIYAGHDQTSRLAANRAFLRSATADPFGF